MSVYPFSFQITGLNAGEAPKTRVSYLCDTADEAMDLVRDAVATMGNVDARYDRETKVLTLVMS